jgi:hypothetical protein
MNTHECFNHNVFDVYLGLTASGYHLANTVHAGSIINMVLDEDWDNTMIKYFQRANQDDGRINPYWPRASILSAVGILTEHTDPTMFKSSVYAYLKTLRNISSLDKSEETANWAVVLPDHVRYLRSNRHYQDIILCYQQAINREIERQWPVFDYQVNTANTVIKSLFPEHQSHVITILNPLQADPLTDIVETSANVWVITSYLRAESFVHESIHACLDTMLPSWIEEISTNIFSTWFINQCYS